MSIMFRPIGLTVAALFVVASCGTDDGATSGSTSTTLPTIATASCDAFAEEGDLEPDLIADLPKEYREAATALNEVGEAVGAATDNGRPSGVIDLFTRPGLGDRWAALGAGVEASCGASSSTEVITALVDAAAAASTPADGDYCADLDAALGPEAATDDGAVGDLASTAPPAHRDVLTGIDAVDSIESDDDRSAVLVASIGLGVYLEDRCDVDGAYEALVERWIAADPSPAADDLEDMSDVDDVDTAGLTAADPASANTLVPSGTELVFETKAIDVDGVGDHVASVVAPNGWLYLTDGSPTFYHPADESESALTIDFGCNDECGPQDWNTVVRAEEGTVETFLFFHDDAVERPVAGSDGVVLTSEVDASALVVRWSPTADAYFSCEVTLDADQADQLPAFVAACEAARPGWIPVT